MIRKLILICSFSILLILSGLPRTIALAQPYVIMISLDGFRPDFLNRGVTPVLSKIAEEGVAATALKPCFPTTSWPNHISAITGLYPEHHGIISNSFFNPITGDTFSPALVDAKEGLKWLRGFTFWTACRNYGIRSASFFYPGDHLLPSYLNPDYVATHGENAITYEKINSIINWLKLPPAQRPHFITMSLPYADDLCHRFGTDSKEALQAFARVDSAIGILRDSLAFMNLADSVNIILFSGHGEKDVQKDMIVRLDWILKGMDCRIENYGAYAMIEPPAARTDEALEKLNKQAYCSAYKRDNIPSWLHFSGNPSILPILMIADPGWLIASDSAEAAASLKAIHGYDSEEKDMAGIFIAAGPAFRKGFYCGDLHNIDVFPLLCRIFNIPVQPGIDGRLDRIEFILNDHGFPGR